MLLSPRKNGLTSLLKEVRVFKLLENQTFFLGTVFCCILGTVGRQPPPANPCLKEGVFWKRGLFRKVHFLELLENLEILENLPQTVENKGQSDHP